MMGEAVDAGQRVGILHSPRLGQSSYSSGMPTARFLPSEMLIASLFILQESVYWLVTHTESCAITWMAYFMLVPPATVPTGELLVHIHNNPPYIASLRARIRANNWCPTQMAGGLGTSCHAARRTI